MGQIITQKVDYNYKCWEGLEGDSRARDEEGGTQGAEETCEGLRMWDAGAGPSEKWGEGGEEVSSRDNSLSRGRPASPQKL